MAVICTNVIEPGSIVEKTIFHVYNRRDSGSNVDLISLEFNDGNFISYPTELRLELPNGDYYLRDGNYIKIE